MLVILFQTNDCEFFFHWTHPSFIYNLSFKLHEALDNFYITLVINYFYTAYIYDNFIIVKLRIINLYFRGGIRYVERLFCNTKELQECVDKRIYCRVGVVADSLPPPLTYKISLFPYAQRSERSKWKILPFFRTILRNVQVNFYPGFGR